ncbi:energy transducer TonB [candidate division CSSED10-310 bacterium]|uniref:Energy transducer TonB n=1 Tax=candidate division CSSED10-310 bacterium TaxID=2855610 RepID=A0ABV6YX84_UNCC1
MPPRYHIHFCLVLSVAVHVLCFTFLPGPRYSTEPVSEIYQVVAVIDFESSAFSALSDVQFEEHVDWLKTIEDVDELDDLADQKNSDDRLNQKILLPQAHFDDVNESYKQKIEKPVLDDTLLTLENEITLLPAGLSEISIHRDRNLGSDKDHFSAPTDQADTKIETPVVDDEQEEIPTESIEGPVASRAVIFKPSPPTQTIETGAIITLKFWVFPDGTVGKIIPLKKGDAHLEQIAINYLKQWRFTPIPKDSAQEDQWGIIPVKFKVY